MDLSFGGDLLAVEGISVVTTTWNEAENIGKLISAVKEVLKGCPHEVIVVDDSSSDGTFEVAQSVADVAVSKKREGQAKGLLHGMKLAKYPVIVTIDSDLENDPKHIPRLLELIRQFDVVVASRNTIPRISERFASKTLGKMLGVTDTFSNFRAFRKETVALFNLEAGETFGAEFLVIAKRRKLRIGELFYDPPERRKNPRIGGNVKANLRIFWAAFKSAMVYLF